MPAFNRPAAATIIAFRMLASVGLASAGLAGVAHAQVATREGNIWDGHDHQPTAGVRAEEQRAGVAASPAQAQSEDQTLSRLNGQLLRKAQQDAKKAPESTTNPYGVQPGGVVRITPGGGGG
jgi:hypothetical protein